MPITVNTAEGTTTFDNADDWEIVDTPVGSVLNVTKAASNGTLSKVIGTFNTDYWSAVKKDPKLDKQQQYEALLELLRDVDDGDFSHQSEEWKDRADALLNP